MFQGYIIAAVGAVAFVYGLWFQFTWCDVQNQQVEKAHAEGYQKGSDELGRMYRATYDAVYQVRKEQAESAYLEGMKKSASQKSK